MVVSVLEVLEVSFEVCPTYIPWVCAGTLVLFKNLSFFFPHFLVPICNRELVHLYTVHKIYARGEESQRGHIIVYVRESRSEEYLLESVLCVGVLFCQVLDSGKATF